MPEARVVDTNVLKVATAAVPSYPEEETPVRQAALRDKVREWLREFVDDPERYVVLDWDWLICKEYQRNVSEQEYGWKALMDKVDKNQVIWVGLSVDRDGNAELPDGVIVDDPADRKMVAAALAATGSVQICRLTNACDTDWLDCESALRSIGIETENLLAEWLKAKWDSKRGNNRDA